MQFKAIFSSTAILITVTSAAAIVKDPHISDFRLYGVTGCSAQNEGVWTVLHSDLNKCTGFNGESVGSVSLTDINKGCKFWVFSDEKCCKGETRVHEGKCANASKRWRSWILKC
ncbi:hypothetical protein BGZ63DRAFT_396760 [Mariannaea sp. PMI_226]|nr:hypothetical protein BGZ63DRAFT_396760 [Mariannaea sp. PMI_226]